ncbi:MAG: glycosyltransferase family 1 protein, partial [Polyangiales bacterium]
VWGKVQQPFPGRVMYSPTHHVLQGADAQVLTVHDLISLRFSRQHPTQHLYFRHILPRELTRCRAVFTVSETTKLDIHEAYGFPLDRIWVVPNGVDRDVFRPAETPVEREPFLLVVGAAFPHKNVEELIREAECWRDRYRLVVVSCRGRYRRQLEELVEAAGLGTRVELIEYASLAELVHLYQTCAAFIYPSRWEGFGIPPLEALACGAPVVVSDIPAHREVLGDHARFVRLGDSSDWGRVLGSLDQPAPAPRTESPLARFTWARSSQLLVQSLREVEPRLGVTYARAATASVA